MKAKITTKNSTKQTAVYSFIGIVFIILKLTGIINWPWIWVLCPFWAWIPIFIVILIIGFIIALFEKQ